MLLANPVGAQELRQSGVRSDHTLDLPPHQAVRCLARNAEHYDGIFAARTQTTDTLVTEVQVREGTRMAALAHVAPWKSGSVATIWRRNSPPIVAGLPDAMAKGC